MIHVEEKVWDEVEDLIAEMNIYILDGYYICSNCKTVISRIYKDYDGEGFFRSEIDFLSVDGRGNPRETMKEHVITDCSIVNLVCSRCSGILGRMRNLRVNDVVDVIKGQGELADPRMAWAEGIN